MVLPLLLLGGGVVALGGAALRAKGILGEDGLIDIPDGDEIGAVVADALEVVFDALPPVMASFSVGVVDGIAESTNAVREALRGRETAVMAGITMALIGWATIRSMKVITGGRVS